MLQSIFMLLIPLLLLLGDLSPTSTPVIARESQTQSIALYYSPKCPHSQKVLAYLKKENLSIPLKDVTQDSQAKEELRVIGGYMIVPCLIVDGKPIYNDSDIIQWLSENRKTFSSNLKRS
jgi:glutaredoxin 3